MVEAEDDGRRRVVIAAVRPSVDDGRVAVKRTLGERVDVEVDLLIDGHDVVAGRLLVRHADDADWRAVPLAPVGRHAVDRFAASFVVDRLGDWQVEVEAWVDRFATWRRGLERKVAAGQDVAVELLGGVALIGAITDAATATREQEPGDGYATKDHDLAGLHAAAMTLGNEARTPAERAAFALDAGLAALAARHSPRAHATRAARPFPVLVEPPLAACAAWYELFPRSLGQDGRHGTLADVEAALPYVAGMGFDVLYLPPIHPIGVTHRKGPNNALVAGPDDPGSPWAIGGAAGGHDALHPALGTLGDFARLVARARREFAIELALDVAFQASPDHPWVAEHPGWFVHRADGTIQHAENPPKAYQDVYPFDFECDDWRGLWRALADVFLVWARRGVRVFRVDNPHTKPIGFWAWCLAEVRRHHPDAIFLSEAFTRPLLLERLAKVGFSQSYTYFTWRTTAADLRRYLEELGENDRREFLRPCFWPNTPDILPEHLQIGGRAIFQQRAILAATLAACWGIYGPAYELCEAAALPGREEYQDSEKFQLRRWDLGAPHGIRPLIARLNKIRREHAALRTDRTLRFHPATNDALLCYSKRAPCGDVVVCVVSLDPAHVQSGFVELDLAALGLDPDAAYQVHDLIGDGRYLWHGARNYVELDPAAMPGQVFAIRHRQPRESSFEYFL